MNHLMLPHAAARFLSASHGWMAYILEDICHDIETAHSYYYGDNDYPGKNSDVPVVISTLYESINHGPVALENIRNVYNTVADLVDENIRIIGYLQNKVGKRPKSPRRNCSVICKNRLKVPVCNLSVPCKIWLNCDSIKSQKKRPQESPGAALLCSRLPGVPKAFSFKTRMDLP